ncbi:serine/threonine protein kinase, STE family, PAK/STE20-related [Lasiosphaeria hispida]|uniref:non-specific serine/threonine protein kinase n=1 Tax=Lasiosphaeria hispida TaxID=260671 RepID=A0AAJ0HJM7_9PEZI|nr:serine/threonine protein kinase, STE family, PAK/STE20-related [Lasiosphaeria hispida]
MELAHMDFASGTHPATKLRAIDNATDMQKEVERECAAIGITPPSYRLTELIGKGSFGRVYKATGPTPAQIVAVKIMSIEEGDIAAPGENDTFSEVLKEINTLKLLNESGAKNINTVIDTLLIGQSMWMVTEYCAGGSVATLMRPTGSLLEMWIVPILREVAEAIYWVHGQCIIHRDIKCANVLITEEGAVQLCDFGVAGTLRSRSEKRRTMTGTLHWMAPELFDGNVSYGSEVDIWAFGSMAFEAATGLPPNAAAMFDVDLSSFGDYLRRCSPRLEGDQFSAQLKDLVAFCMVPDPAKRPRIEQIQKHPYIFGTAERRPTNTLARLVAAYREWESQGGGRRSLFSAGGAQGVSRRELCPILSDEGWDYGTVEEADQLNYGHALENVTIPAQPSMQRRRHRRLHQLKVPGPSVKAPLEKAFDPHTISNYRDHARVFYRMGSSPTLQRSTDDENTICESPIKTSISSVSIFSGQETIKPLSRTNSSDRTTTNRRFGTSKTKDWTFPKSSVSLVSPVGMSCPALTSDGDALFISNPGPPTSSQEAPVRPKLHIASSRASAMSLIDLDASLPTPPETGFSMIFPMTLDPSQPGANGNTFEPAFASVDAVSAQLAGTLEPDSRTSSDDDIPRYREPSLYIRYSTAGIHLPVEGNSQTEQEMRLPRIVLGSRTVSDESARSASLGSLGLGGPRPPPLPMPPAEEVILGLGSREALREEVTRLFASMGEHLRYAGHKVAGMDGEMRR